MTESNLNSINKIKNKIFNRSGENTIIDIYHYLMIHYGYIPFNEFKKMDAFLVEELIEKLNKMNKSNEFSSNGRFFRRNK